MNIVVLISADAEWAGVKPLFPDVQISHFTYGEYFQVTINNVPVSFFHAGWGKTASAAAFQHILDKYNPDLTINLGTCGGFAGVVNQGDLILVEQTFMYDIVELMGDMNISEYY